MKILDVKRAGNGWLVRLYDGYKKYWCPLLHLYSSYIDDDFYTVDLAVYDTLCDNGIMPNQMKSDIKNGICLVA